MARAKRFYGSGNRTEIFLVRRIDSRPRIMKIDGAVVAFLVCAKKGASHQFGDRRPDRPPEWIDGTNRQHRSAAVPTGARKRFSAVFGGVRVKRPGRVGAP